MPDHAYCRFEERWVIVEEDHASDTGLPIKHSRTPQQLRSKESFDRVLEAAADLLREGGITSLTLAEVSRRSRVSIGSIYCRVDSKEDLLRAVQEHVYGTMDQEFSRMIDRIRRRNLPIRDLVQTLVREQAGFLRRHLGMLNAFIEQAARDPVVAAVGQKYHARSALDFKQLLLERHDDFAHADPERAAAASFDIVYGTLARSAGLGISRDKQPGESDWKRLVDDLGLAILAFLTVDLRPTPPLAKRSVTRGR